MRRREFITLLSGTMVIWPIALRAQQREQIARIGVLMGAAAEDPEGQARITAFRQGLQKLGLTEGQNVRIDVRWTAGDAALERKFAAELVTLTPDVILASASPTVAALQAVTRTVPIVFAGTIDPVGGGFVDSLAAAGRQYYRFRFVRIQHGREMARTSQGDRAKRDASSGPSGSGHSFRDGAIRRHPIRSAIVRGGIDSR
jgi:ABC-type uncharacterized transport system substrate-binding protein